jgi:hypothetical protein
MRKVVLLLMCIALFSFCPSEHDYPLIDLITTSKVLDDVKNLFGDTRDEEQNHADDESSGYRVTLAKFIEEASKTFRDITSKDETHQQGEILESPLKDQQSLDLSLPLDDHQDDQLSDMNGEHKARLPDLFSPLEIKEKTSRASIGGRLLMDENNPNYTMDAVLGAEVSLELKTH